MRQTTTVSPVPQGLSPPRLSRSTGGLSRPRPAASQRAHHVPQRPFTKPFTEPVRHLGRCALLRRWLPDTAYAPAAKQDAPSPATVPARPIDRPGQQRVTRWLPGPPPASPLGEHKRFRCRSDRPAIFALL